MAEDLHLAPSTWSRSLSRCLHRCIEATAHEGKTCLWGFETWGGHEESQSMWNWHIVNEVNKVNECKNKMQRKLELTSNLWAISVPFMRLWTTSIIRGSISTAMTLWAACNNSRVRFPVLGPISRTVSLSLMSAFSTMDLRTPGFVRMWDLWECAACSVQPWDQSTPPTDSTRKARQQG